MHTIRAAKQHTNAGYWFFVAIIVVLLVGAFYFMRSKDTTAPANQTLTLYYNDGKTVLWQTGQPEGDNAAFITYARNQLEQLHAADYQSKGAWKVTTTLDKQLQEVAVSQFKAQRQAINRAGMSKLLLVAEDVTTGQVTALAAQQPNETNTHPIADRTLAGTLATPFSYIALLEKSPERANGTFEDTQTALPGYPCTNREAPKNGGNCLFNLDMRYLGTLNLSQALGGFRNVTAVKAMTETGNATYEVARTMGSDGVCYGDKEMTSETPCYSAAAFGEGLYVTPQHILQAYATLANRGRKLPQTVLLKTVLNGKQQYAWHQSTPSQVIDSQTAATIGDILADPNASFMQETHKDVFSRQDGKKTAVVSGYTQDSSGSSSIQFTDHYVVGFWGSANSQLTGSHVQSASVPMAAALLKATK